MLPTNLPLINLCLVFVISLGEINLPPATKSGNTLGNPNLVGKVNPPYPASGLGSSLSALISKVLS